MLLDLPCPRCQRKLLVPSKKVGKPLNCPACDVRFTPKVVATAVQVPRKVVAKRPPGRTPAAVAWQPLFPFVTGSTKGVSRPSDRRNRPRTRFTPGIQFAAWKRPKAWVGGIVATTALLATGFFFSEPRQEGSLRFSPVETAAANVKPDEYEEAVPRASTEEKMFANWSIYHSTQGGFSVYMPDRREEKGHLRSEALGLDGRGVQAQFVQLPNTNDPIESWPAIGEVWLRAIWVDTPAPDSSAPDRPALAALIPAGVSPRTVTVGDLPGNEFVLNKGNETQKVRLFVNGGRTIVLSATFVGRESGNDAGLPFGEQVDCFLDSVRFKAEPVGEVASVAGPTGDGAADSFAIVERYVCELTGKESSEEIVRTRVNDLKVAARKAKASPQEVLTLLRTAKAEAEATGVSSELAIRAVTGMLGSKAQRKR